MSSAVSIEVRDVGKQYRLGLVGTGTLSHDLNRWWALVRGKPDPYLQVGEVNRRDQQGKSDYVWALRDVSFETHVGEAVGIIGANGAGKSTLLKLLSRVTGPSTGTIKMRGRIASLLEVGTGFHRELTGRENVYLNGTIMGLTRAEVAARIDEIFAFSGVERYADTPIKRYSTGMKVRLAFAVAAHLDPEILIVDEVLAVGDAEFQRKAIGKMREVAAGTGRTVLFVSHNMDAVARLCTRGIVLDQGRLVYDGPIADAIRKYAVLNFGKTSLTDLSTRTDRKGRGNVRFSAFTILDAAGEPANYLAPGRPGRLRAQVKVRGGGSQEVYVGIGLRDSAGAPLTLLAAWARGSTVRVCDGDEIDFIIDELVLVEGEYLVDLYCEDGGPGNTVEDHLESAASLLVEGQDFFGSGQVSGNFRYQFYQAFTLNVVR